MNMGNKIIIVGEEKESTNSLLNKEDVIVIESEIQEQYNYIKTNDFIFYENNHIFSSSPSKEQRREWRKNSK